MGITLVPCILQILTTFNFYSGRPGVGLSVNNKQKVRQAMVKISRGGVATTPLPPPPRQICQPKWLDHRRVKIIVIVAKGKFDAEPCDFFIE